jgi:hypothetical protein
VSAYRKFSDTWRCETIPIGPPKPPKAPKADEIGPLDARTLGGLGGLGATSYKTENLIHKRFSENHEATASITPVADDDWQRQADGVAMLLAEGLADEDALPDIRKAVRSFVGESNRLFGTGIEISATTPSARPDKTDKSPSVSSVSDHRRVSENHVVPGTLEPVADPDRDFEERAAISEYCGRLPRAIAEVLARLETMQPPEGFTPSWWEQIINGAAIFADRWGARALELGWEPIELFGIHPVAPAARHDCRGLAFMLDTP